LQEGDDDNQNGVYENNNNNTKTKINRQDNLRQKSKKDVERSKEKQHFEEEDPEADPTKECASEGSTSKLSPVDKLLRR